MKQADVMPAQGQFVAVWVYGGGVWSDTFRWTDDGDLERYSVIPDSLVSQTETSEIWESVHASEFPFFGEDTPRTFFTI